MLTPDNLRSTYMEVPEVSLMEAVAQVPSYTVPGFSSCIKLTILYATTMLGLTQEEVATIKTYTGECLYQELNNALRTEQYIMIKPWFAYLKLFQLALTKLKTEEGTFCRGERRKWTVTYQPGEIITWVHKFILIPVIFTE